MTSNNEPQQLLRLPSVCKLTGLSKSSLYASIAAGTFPKGIKIGPRSAAWLSSEINGWIMTRVEQSRATLNKQIKK